MSMREHRKYRLRSGGQYRAPELQRGVESSYTVRSRPCMARITSAGAMVRQVARCGPQVRVPELGLDDVHRDTLARQLGGVRVAEAVGMDTLLDARLVGQARE